MYGWLWRTFPGGIVGKLLCSLVLAALAVVHCRICIGVSPAST